MHSRLIGALAGLTVLGLASTAKAIPVDLELSLVIDSSTSINASERTDESTMHPTSPKELFNSEWQSNPHAIRVN